MFQFISSREKRLWIFALLVCLTIISSLFFRQPFQVQLQNQNLQAVLFILGMFLVTITVFFHGILLKPGRYELVIIIGLLAVYVLFFLRLGAAERSHMIEYSILAVFIHSALIERFKVQNLNKIKIALSAFLLVFLIGILDESIQYFLPHRVFDLQDILFNGIVTAFAVISLLILNWIQKRLKQRQID